MASQPPRLCLANARAGGESSPRRESFYSLGDGELTATVGASGRLLQISRHFPGQSRGFCVDEKDMDPPNFTPKRFQQLLSKAEDALFAGGIGPRVDSGAKLKEPHSAKFLHDRWPAFGQRAENGMRIDVQYVVSEGTLYQHYSFDYNGLRHKNSAVTQPLRLTFAADVLIRNLDYEKLASEDDHFNEPSHSGYEPPQLMNGCIVRGHQIKDKGKVFLCVAAFDEDSSPCFFKRAIDASQPTDDTICDQESSHHYVLEWIQGSSNHNNDGKHVVTIAYTLEYAKIPFTSMISGKTTSKALRLFGKPFEEQHFTDDPDINISLRRNLEHILSVCSVPVSSTDEQKPHAIALTCGDIDGHRIATAASFYAFQILLLAWEHFQAQHVDESLCTCGQNMDSESKESYICAMTRRIERACRGHLRWVFHYANNSSETFSSHYWVNGSRTSKKHWANGSWTLEKSLVDSPFQIIKAGDFYKTFWGPLPDKNIIQEAITMWIAEIDQINKMGLYAFPRYDDKPMDTFYLADHVLIWRAIKSAEDMRLLPGSRNTTSTMYTSKRLQQNILRRFTTENPYSNATMIAVTRSPVQNRFFLRSKDTTLFCAAELGLFDKDELEHGHQPQRKRFIDGWENLMDCQKQHDGNDDTFWDEPRRFALAIIMAQHKKPINLRPTGEILRHAISVLLKSSFTNGLFPGKLNKLQEPLIFDDYRERDTYWGTTFEVPYILWKYLSNTNPLNTPERMTDPASPVDLKVIASHLSSLSQSVSQIDTFLREATAHPACSRGPQLSDEYSMKMSLPLSSPVNPENIAELRDEWLYKRPAFFVGETADKSTSDWEGQDRLFFGVVINVWKSGQIGGPLDDKGDDLSPCSWVLAWRIEEMRKQGRTIEKAKKRFWAFLLEEPRHNEICRRTISAEEPWVEGFASFLSRHKSHYKFFTEETSAALNTWMTELHMSFYDLKTRPEHEVQKSSTRHRAKSTVAPALGVDMPRIELTRIAMGFQFEGDLFNNYWTCRLLQADQPTKQKCRELAKKRQLDEQPAFLDDNNNPWMAAERLLFQKDIFHLLESKHAGHLEKNAWQQRRVLELMLFGRIVRRMNHGARNVFAKVRSSIRRKDTSNRDTLATRHQTDSCHVQHDTFDSTTEEPDELDYDVFDITVDDYIITRKSIEEAQRILQKLDRDLDENIAQIAIWRNREKDRQAERPRWTFDDESRFRSSIQKLTVSNEHDIQRLKRVHLNISKLEESLAKRLEAMRSDVDDQRANNTQIFTYVTVVFLPLGFATGIFSMSEAPAGILLTNMAVTALGALVVTAVLLIGAKTADSAGLVKMPQFTNRTRQEWAGLKKDLAMNLRRRRNNKKGDLEKNAVKSHEVSH